MDSNYLRGSALEPCLFTIAMRQILGGLQVTAPTAVTLNVGSFPGGVGGGEEEGGDGYIYPDGRTPVPCLLPRVV